MNYAKHILIWAITINYFFQKIKCGPPCTVGYYNDPPNGCTLCPQQFCIDCDINGCTDCDTDNLHRQPVGGLCVPIAGYFEQNNPAATQCDDPNKCQLCSASNKCDQCKPRFFKTSSDSCQGCSFKCAICTNATFCDDCDQKFGIQYYTSPIRQLCQPCNQLENQCIQCQQIKKCLNCASPYIVDERMGSKPYYTCIQCIHIQNECISCINGPICTKCIDGYYIHSPTQCKICNQPHCLTCSSNTVSNTVCTSCQTYYEVVNDNCVQICGDGIAIGDICDLLPQRQYDGCTDQCTAQIDFTCNVDGNRKICSYYGPIVFSINSIKKQTFENILIVQVKFSPALTIFLDNPETFLLPYLTLKDQNGNQLEASFSSNSGQNSFIATVKHTRSLQNQKINIFYDPISSTSDQLKLTTQQTGSFEMAPSNSYAYYYSQSEYLTCGIYYYVSMIICAFVLLLMIIELFSNNLTILQLLLVIQFGYCSLLWYDTEYLMPPYGCLTPLWLSNGYNYHYQFPARSQTVSAYTLDVTSYMASNYNIVLFLIIVIPILLRIILFIFKYLPVDKLKQIAEQKTDMFYQWGLYLQIFAFTQYINCLILFYGTPSITTISHLTDIPSNVVTFIGLIFFLLVFVYYLVDPSNFGKFNTSFCMALLSKRNFLVNIIYIVILLILVRFLQGYFLIIPLILSFTLIIYMLAYRPYFSQFSNIRSAIIYFGYPLFISLRVFFSLYDSQQPNVSTMRIPQFVFVGVVIVVLLVLTIFAMIQLIYYFVDRYYIQPRLRHGLLFQVFDKDTSYKKGMEQLLQMKKFLKQQKLNTKINIFQDPMFHYKKLNIPKLQQTNQSIKAQEEKVSQYQQMPEIINDQNENSPNQLILKTILKKQETDLEAKQKMKIIEDLVRQENQIVRFQKVKIWIDEHGTTVDQELLKQFDQI